MTGLFGRNLKENSGPSSRKAGRFSIPAIGVGQICSWGTLYYSFPQIAAAMHADLGWSNSEIYGALTVGLLLSGVAALPAGILIDRGYGRIIMTMGSVFAGILLIAWSFVGSLFWFYVVFAGIGMLQAAVLYNAAFAVIAGNFDPEQTKSSIITLTLWGGFAGTIFIPFIELILHYGTWRVALILLGLINIFICAGIYRTVPKPTRNANAPADENLTTKAPRRGSAWAIRQPVFRALLLTFALYAGIVSAYKFHLYPLLIYKELALKQVVIILALVGPAQVLGRIVMKLFASRATIINTGIVTTLIIPIALGAIAFTPPNSLVLLPIIIALGAAGGAMTIIKAVAIPEFLTRNDYGAVNGILSMPITFIKAFAPTLAAVSRQVTGSYELLLISLSLAGLIMSLCFGFAIRFRKGRDASAREKSA